MKTILITGSDGFIGSHLTDFCLMKGFRVIALKKPTRNVINLIRYTDGKRDFTIEELSEFKLKKIRIPTNNKNLLILECDIKNADLIEVLVEEFRPKMIFHFAAQPLVIPSWEDPIDTIRTNVIGTINVFEPIKKHKLNIKVILACSSAEYGTTTDLDRALKETDLLLAIHPYGISKIAAELLARQYFINYGIEVINLRFFNQTGPRKENDVVSDFVIKVAKIDSGIAEPIINVGNINTYRDITGIKDTIQATWLAATRGTPGETYNVCSGRKIYIREILEKILKFSNNEIKIKEDTEEKLRKTDEKIILGDNSKIKKELGFKISQSIDELLRETYEYWIEYFSSDTC
ncbi:MAG: GDP-mannose 4,6-dehydratase [Candidatus Lokiarchaeota archaeon]|nr:GDP-mannose 4,6-dehydratase [Candidatus Lokiarchaeota archaeon]